MDGLAHESLLQTVGLRSQLSSTLAGTTSATPVSSGKDAEAFGICHERLHFRADSCMLHRTGEAEAWTLARTCTELLSLTVSMMWKKTS